MGPIMGLSTTADGASAPILSSSLARLGVGVLVLLSIFVGFNYWMERGEDQLAIMTVGAEIIAFAGLVMVRHHWQRNWGWALIGLILTALAATWCGMTMFEKISADARERAVAAAEQTLPYRMAARDFEAASEALRAKLAEDQPSGVGPDTLRSWEAGQAAAVARLTRERDNAEARLRTATPEVSLDVMAIVRGVGVEMIKLLGFAAFGLIGPIETSPRTAPVRVKRSLWSRARAWLGLGAIATGMVGVSHAEPLVLSQVVADATPAGPPSQNVLALPTDARSKAFAMRDRFGGRPNTHEIIEIATACGVSRSTVYRWFAKRDKEIAAAAAARPLAA